MLQFSKTFARRCCQAGLFSKFPKNNKTSSFHGKQAVQHEVRLPLYAPTPASGDINIHPQRPAW